ncbi:phosphopantetheine-binding protein [Arthrobacter sp. I2-34]|uniref:Phosphopantetheine-binding protein n=1 Tax=Arthrobacter hankyongi TaxID=2904801 RepID=A0ABS9LDY2_9MICC|nr:Pls/PosA family non-ribosomal peptide synthetase [Arthrobacter hankyongi]MCG2624909.1 phosphopantetheine-binding protein [Arthrobacter hankyongi]
MKKLIADLREAPRSTTAAGNGSLGPPATGAAVALERRLADLLASVVEKDDVPVDANFFQDLGADSMVMAKFCARVRKQPDLPHVSIKDIYQNPTISALAAGLAPTEAAPATAQMQVRLAEVLSGVLGVEQVPMNSDFFKDLGADSMVMAKFCARVRKDPDLPSVSIKDIYQNPSISALATGLAPTEAAPATAQMQVRLAEVLSGVLGVEQVPMNSDFFKDLGADSMVMAKFCARVRKDPDLPSVSMKDVYGNPNISALATALAPAQQEKPQAPSPAVASVPETPAPMDARTWEFIACGVLQTLVYLGYCVVGGLATVVWYQWVFPEAGPGNHQWLENGLSFFEIYLRSTAYAAAVFAAMCILPVAAKWIIVGRFRPREIRIWSLAYFRFWLVKTLMRTSPLVLMTGSPVMTFYLRAMGAKVGRNVTILTNRLPVATDLLTIGEGTVIRKDVFANGYRAHGGVIQIGAVTLGRDVTVGEGSVLDIDTTMGDGSQLGHRSTLYTGQAVPEGERWHGSPGRRTDVDYSRVERTPYRPVRRALFAMSQLITTLGLGRILVGQAVILFVLSDPNVATLLEPQAWAFTSWVFYSDALLYAGLGVFGGTIVVLLLITTVPRVLQLALKPDTVYPTFGWRYAAERAMARMTNSRFLPSLFGDSSYVVNFVAAIGYKQGKVQQTGSNLGTMFKHDNPFLSEIGTGSMIADGVSFMNTEHSPTSFKMSRAAVGAHSFLGNFVLYPAGARTGDNCLLATKVMVPIDGPVRQDVGLLGSPPFEIPRSVLRDALPKERVNRTDFRRDLAAKNRHNLRSMTLLMLVRWLNATVGLLVAFAGLELSDQFGFLAISASFVALFVVELLVQIGIEHLVRRFRPLEPRLCSIYHPYFWWHERYWKLLAGGRFMLMLNGTPFKPLLWRVLGVRIGSRVFDDGCYIPERTLVTIGSRCTLNSGTQIQSHSQEDGMFKSDYDVIGDDVTLGVAALVHYGVTVEDRVVVTADSFVMKGETLTQGSLWGGNPAVEASAATTSTAAMERPLS